MLFLIFSVFFKSLLTNKDKGRCDVSIISNGSWFKHGLSKKSSFEYNDNSPDFDLQGSPVAPIISPLLILLCKSLKLRFLSSYCFSLHIICTFDS